MFPIKPWNVKFGRFQPLIDDLCNSGGAFPAYSLERKMKTAEFFSLHPVFSLDEASKLLAPPGGRSGTLERLKYHLETGRVKLAARGVYAVVPPGTQTEDFRPDPFLVAAAIRPDGVFSHHSALELLGVAHSVWNQCTLYAAERRRPLRLDETTIRFLDHPGPLRKGSGIHLGTRKIERQGKLLLDHRTRKDID